MYPFSQQSEANIATCHPDIQKVMRRAAERWDHSILVGHRGEVEQNKAHATGHSTKKWPFSEHNKIPSDAVDALPWPYSWDDLDGKNGRASQLRAWIQGSLFIGYVLRIADEMYASGEISAPLTTGVDWDNDHNIEEEKFLDLPHLQRRKA